MYEKGIKDSIPWVGKMHSYLIRDEWAELCKSMGCFQISLGIEHMDAQMRKNVLMKTAEDEDIERSVALLKKNNIACTPYFIFCAPQETLRTFFLNFKKLISMCAVKNFISFYYPLPKTKMAKRFGDGRENNAKNNLYSFQHIRRYNVKTFLAATVLNGYKIAYYILMGVYYRKVFFS